MGWTPNGFWTSTPLELYRAIEGWQDANGVDADRDAPITLEEVEELMEMFPDG